ncbi:MAG: thioredoxin domain-containing protein [Candidatus Magasanikbacteria bacterium]|nr:thioredoxin domain-containing protein [Candidatus Magasanikbacteria bacterium]
MQTNNLKSIFLWGGFILGTVLLLIILAKLGSNSGEKTANVKSAKLAEEINELDHGKGNQQAPAVLVEYSDFQCPACAATYPLLKRLSEELPDTLYLVYRHFPLKQIHPNAQPAAEAAEAAAKQGKFWEMHDSLFNTQTDWTGLNNPEEFFINLASSLGLDLETFKTDLRSKETQNRVDRDYKSGIASGIPGTPTFFLNGTRISNPGTYEQFKQLIESTINAS